MLKKVISLVFISASILAGYFIYTQKNNSETLIPRDIIFGNPDKARVKLSPNGEFMSFLAPYQGVLNIWVAPIKDVQNAKPITSETDRGIRDYYWGFTNQHIIYTKDTDGDENYKIYSQNLNDEKVTLLTPEKGVKALILQMDYKFPNEIIVGANDNDPRFFNVYKYNFITGERELLLQNDKYDSVIVDSDYKIRFATLINDNGDREYFQFIDNSWTHFMTVSFEDSDTTDIVDFDKTGNIIYLQDSRNRNTSAIEALDLKTGNISIIAEDDKADSSILTIHPTEKNIQIVASNYEKIEYTIIDPNIKGDMEFLATLGDGQIFILDRTIDDKFWAVALLKDDYPIKYYIYDRQNHKADFLFTNSKALESYKLSPMHPVIIKSRDGLSLVSYITFPKNAKIDQNLRPQKPLPMILNVHGGPWSRDVWGFDPETLFLADRGYAVLSVNYRGSSGFGKNFSNAGNLQWGKKMHDDLIDGVNWAIQNKIADPQKIVIMGGSYGGYAALSGITLTPDVFAGAVDIVGPSNLLTLVKNFPPYWHSFIKTMKKRIGDWDTEEGKQALMEVSPLFHVDKITKPLLIGQGANDPRVTQLESDQIVASMKKRNIPVVYALYKNEGHGFYQPGNRISFYAITEQFLAKILNGKAEPLNDNLTNPYLILNGNEALHGNEVEKIIEKATNYKTK